MLSNPRPPWHFEDPLCAEVGVDLFFSKDRDDPTQDDILEDSYSLARTICDSCEHKIECAEWAIRNEIHGLWGGTSPRDRRSIRTKLKITVINHQTPEIIKGIK
jgi:hypothetical protein